MTERVKKHQPTRDQLAAFFRPLNVALVGASDRSSWSNSIFARFNEYGHKGKLFAVNRNGTEAHGLPGYTSVAAIPETIDTAYIYVPAEAVAGALREAAAAGVRNTVVLSSGFAEAGEAGEALQAELAAAAAETGVTMLGPNSLGFANFGGSSFCTSVRSRLPVRIGQLALVSQSGAVAAELAKWAHAQGIGLSFFCATGNEAQIGIADVVEFLVDDPATKAIALYVEGIGDPVRFMAAAARARAAKKPIVVLKIGRSQVSSAVVQAHTGSMVGDNRVFDAMCDRFGVSRVNSMEELITTAELLGRTGAIDPPRIGMASVSGGACGMYADLAELNGLAIEPFTAETKAALAAALPSFAATLNPLDVTGVAIQNTAIWSDIIPSLARDPGVGLVVIGYGIPNTLEERRNLDTSFAAIAEGYRTAGAQPVILSYSVQDAHEPQFAIRAELGIDTVLPNIDLGVRALAHLQRWSENLLAEDPLPLPEGPATSPTRLTGERAVLDHLAAHGVPVIGASLAKDADAAAAAARGFGGPVALKIASPDIAHKTEVGGVKLDLEGDEAVRGGFEAIMASAKAAAPNARIDGILVSPMRGAGTELIVGVARDPQWGPVLAVGLGGVFTEALQDSRLSLLPVTPKQVRGLLEGLRGAKLLQGFRGSPPADIDKLSRAIAAIGDAALALGSDLAALEVNPLWVRGDEIECLDGLAIYEA